MVRADGEREVPAEEVVPGDVVLLESGGRVPADVRLLEAVGLATDESLLTGEAEPAAKDARAALAEDAALGDRATMAYAGTIVAAGRGRAVVVATGSATQVGQIARSVDEAETVAPPLIARMARFSRGLAVASTVCVGALALVAVAQGHTFAEVTTVAVALLVAAVPEGLAISLTVALAVATRRMAKRRVITRRLASVEALGSCTFVASDKTGTLTMNELSCTHVALPGGPGRAVAEVLAARRAEGAGVTDPDPVRDLVEAAARASEVGGDAPGPDAPARGGAEADRGRPVGDAVDRAVLALHARALGPRAPAPTSTPALPYESERGYAAHVFERDGAPWVAVKGAVERVLPMCATAPGAGAPDAVLAQAAALADAGQRVLAVAWGPLPAGPGGGAGPGAAGASAEGLAPERLRGLELLGLLGLRDPLRPGARAALAACRDAGIEVAMVTGDHPGTALAVSRELGLTDDPARVLTGARLREASREGPAAVDALVREARVFARVEPTQKLEIVQSLIRLGHIVAVTGDGANDAPALRAAHVGVAMGKRGTDVAREAADLILADDDFSSLVAGVEEGRIAYANVRKVIFLLLSIGAAEIALFVLARIFDLPTPLLAVQLLWLNLVTNGIQDKALALEPPEGDELARPPRPPAEPIFDRRMIERVLLSATLMGVLAFAMFRTLLQLGEPVESARNAVLLLMVLFEVVQCGNARSERSPVLPRSPLENPWLLGAALLALAVHLGAMHLPWISGVLHVAPVSLPHFLGCGLLAVLVFAALEVHKHLRLRAR